ncbi:methyltransferase family protein [Halomonas nitroreducens]|uniref:methyltransferase family protein n=1 Tax=Halomonas nitroreducens TaxID=447425 RepID=UPI001FEB6502|nr:methyltransferase [Halomonas nitroreducens]
MATIALVTSGLYALVRHPQYRGLFIALFGEGVVHWPTLFSVGLFPVIVLACTWLAHREKRQMLARFVTPIAPISVEYRCSFLAGGSGGS